MDAVADVGPLEGAVALPDARPSSVVGLGLLLLLLPLRMAMADRDTAAAGSSQARWARTAGIGCVVTPAP